jgi:hypothetical protein
MVEQVVAWRDVAAVQAKTVLRAESVMHMETLVQAESE